MIDLKNIKVLEELPNKGTFEIQPLDSGFGLTIGNALRRTLLSSLKGFCICAVKIEGISHEFSVINGILEDVTEIILNIKQIRLKKQIKGEVDFEICKALIGDQEVVTAGDLGKFINSFQVLNPDLIICHKDKLVNLHLSFIIKIGTSYVSAEEQKFDFDLDPGFITIDAIHSPILTVKYKVENCRVEQKIDYEKLLLEVNTNGSISPKDALTESSKILIDHFSLFLDQSMDKKEDQPKIKAKSEENKKLQSLLKSDIKDLGFSVRTMNCLDSAGIKNILQLIERTEQEVNSIRNLGTKSKEEIKTKLKERGLHLGMDLNPLGN